MTNYDPKDIGKFFVKGGEVYKLIGYCSTPTVTFKNIKTGETTGSVGIHGLIAQDFKRLVEQDD